MLAHLSAETLELFLAPAVAVPVHHHVGCKSRAATCNGMQDEASRYVKRAYYSMPEVHLVMLYTGTVNQTSCGSMKIEVFVQGCKLQDWSASPAHSNDA